MTLHSAAIIGGVLAVIYSLAMGGTILIEWKRTWQYLVGGMLLWSLAILLTIWGARSIWKLGDGL